MDVYRVLLMFAVTDPCLQHAIKKLLVAGGRGAGKDIRRDVAEAVDSLVRWQEMREEDATPAPSQEAPVAGANWAIRQAQAAAGVPTNAYGSECHCAECVTKGCRRADACTASHGG